MSHVSCTSLTWSKTMIAAPDTHEDRQHDCSLFVCNVVPFVHSTVSTVDLITKYNKNFVDNTQPHNLQQYIIIQA